MDLRYHILPTFTCEVSNGQLTFPVAEQSRLTKWLLSNSGKWVLHLEKPRKPRSLAANRYYFGVIVPIVADYMGESDDAYVHAILKGMFLSKKVFIKGKEYTAVGRTSKMTTQQFSDYIERVVQWCASEGLVVPPADKDYYVRELESEVKGL